MNTKYVLGRMKIASIATAILLSVLFAAGSLATPALGSEQIEPVDQELGAISITYSDGSEFTSSAIETGLADIAGAISVDSNSFARAGGYFTWSASWRASITSRQWTTTKKANIYVKVAPVANCKSTTKVQLSLRKIAQVGTPRQVPCSGGTYVWKMVDPGKFTFLLTGAEKPNAALYYETSGAVGYDGSGV